MPPIGAPDIAFALGALLLMVYAMLRMVARFRQTTLSPGGRLAKASRYIGLIGGLLILFSAVDLAIRAARGT